MDIENITLLNQFITYSCDALTIFLIIIIAVILLIIAICLIENLKYSGLIILIAAIAVGSFGLGIATIENSKTFLNYPAYTHYVIQINDKAAWSEIAPNYTIVEEIYPNTNIYEIKKVYEEGDEQ